MDFETWRNRLIPARPRGCHLSTELQASAKDVFHLIAALS
jgi:hypothetical protein